MGWTFVSRRRAGPHLAGVWCALLTVGLLTAVSTACGEEGSAMTDEQKRERLATLYRKYERKFPAVESIDVAGLLELQRAERQIVVVDVRETAEQQVSMIPTAITRQEFEARQEDFAGAVVVTYCTAGYRSGLYAQELAARGWDVRNLAGSILAWTLEGQPLVDAQGDTKRVHTYGPDWNLAGEGYKAVWEPKPK